MSSDGRQRLSGKSSVRGMVSSPFVFIFYIVQNFVAYYKVVSPNIIFASNQYYWLFDKFAS
jgi:hypothetical protein